MKNSSAARLFTKEEISQIESAIAEVEKSTSGEVVPVVASVSGRYDRAEDLFGFLFALVVLASVWIGFQGIDAAAGQWGGGSTLMLNLPITLLILLVSFVVGTGLATFFPVLRLPFIVNKEMEAEVEKKARETFQQLRIRSTRHATGILIYVSLYEHMVRVLGDDAISDKLSQDDWQETCDLIIAGFKNGTPAAGLCAGIRHCGELLTPHFPVQEGDVNELPDKLHLID